MCKQHRWLMGLSLALIAGSSSAQNVPQQTPRVPNARPTLSPYVNLLNSGTSNPGFIYSGIIQPQVNQYVFNQRQQDDIRRINQTQRTNVSQVSQSLQGQQKQITRLAKEYEGQPTRDATHRGAFMSRSRHFPGHNR